MSRQGRGRWSRILSLHCDAATELVSQELDEPLGLADRLALRSHILICRSCRRFQRQVRRIHQAARTLERARAAAVAEEMLSPEARRRIVQALREGAPDDGAPPP